METEDLAKQLLSAFSKMNKFHSKQHAKAHIKKSEMAVIAVLESRGKEEGLKITQISNYLQLPPSAVTPVINTLEKDGLVVRSNSPEDRRIVMARLTEKGRECYEKKQKFFLGKVMGLCDHLGEKDAKELIRLINITADYLVTEFQAKEDKNTPS